MRLLLLRHAKSSWDEAGVTDFDRPLAPRGNRDAPRMSAHMIQQGLAPTLILTSAAKRTRQTLAHLLAGFSHDFTVQAVRALYDADGAAYIDIANHWRGSHGCILMIGHNPSIQDAALQLCGGAHDAAGHAAMRAKYSTCALAAIDFGEKPLASGAGMLISFTRPADLFRDTPD